MALDIIELREANAPKLGDPAPDQSVTRRETGAKVKLSTFWKSKPAVLIFGSLSCDRTFDGAENLRNLYFEYGDKYQFVFIYLREAHPADGWRFGGERYPTVIDAKTQQIRQNVSARLCQTHDIAFPVVTDDMEDHAAIAYAAWPSRLYVVNQDGTIAYQGHPGPWGYKPAEDSRIMDLSSEPSARTAFVPDPKTAISLEAFLGSTSSQ